MPPKAVARELARRKRLEQGLSDPADPTTWDDEELENERVRNAQGHFAGRPPGGERMTGKHRKAIRDEKYKRKLTAAKDLLLKGQPDAARVLWEIAKDEKAPTKDRITAAIHLLDRGFGSRCSRWTCGRRWRWASGSPEHRYLARRSLPGRQWLTSSWR
jgi:hypothetical protein